MAYTITEDFIIKGTVLKKYTGNAKEIDIPEGITEISSKAFTFCDELISIVIPDSVESIDGDAFDECTSLISIDVKGLNKFYASEDGILFNKHKTELIRYPAGKTNTSFSVPNSVQEIAAKAFQGCIHLETISIPNQVEEIKFGTFSDCCSLRSLNIPDETKVIESCAFFWLHRT